MVKNYNFFNVRRSFNELNLGHALIALVLITLPLKNIYTSIATILFVGWAFFFSRKHTISKANYWPLVYFAIMVFSVIWSEDFASSIAGVQKQLSMLFIPLAFFFIPKITRDLAHQIIRMYSYVMAFFGLFFLLKAALVYLETNNTSVFFHDELVPYDPGVIYISVFASLAVFYFIQVQAKTYLDRACIFVLVLLIMLMSSKSIITIDFIIVICYYAFFAEIPSNTKTITILSVSLFLFLSLYFVKQVRERFLIEYETAFIDNTINQKLTKDNQNIYNVSINEAWNKTDFNPNNFFPGTALRIYQIRIFSEMVVQDPIILLNGVGLEASQNRIREKAREHNLNLVYAEHNFHNQYLQTILEMGAIGFLVLIVMLSVILKKALVNKDFLHIAFAITMIMLFLSESFFCRQRGIVFFITLYCLFNSVSNEKETIKSS